MGWDLEAFDAGAWYAEQAPTGEFVYLVPGDALYTHLGRIPFPAGEAFGIGNPPRLTLIEGFRFAGQAHDTLDPACWEWDRTRIDGPITPDTAKDGWVPYPPPCHGVNACIYDREGVLYRASPLVGSQGYRYVDLTNALITGDQTRGPFHGIMEYTALDTPNCWIGHGTTDGSGVIFLERIPGPLPAEDQWISRQVVLGDTTFVVATERDGRVGIAWKTPQGTGRRVGTLAYLRSLPLVTAPVEPLPAIGRPLWIGCFEFNRDTPTGPGVPGLAPGNTLLAVRNWRGLAPRPFIEADETAGLLNGEVLGYYLSGTSVAEIERRAATLVARPVVYWDARRWPRWPSVPPGSWICVQAYQPLGETLEAFERDLRSILAEASHLDRGIALVCQQYTSNSGLTPEIRAQIPVYLRLARDYPAVVALLLFSGYGRAGGLQDHPDVEAIWHDYVPTVAVPPQQPYPPDDGGGSGGDGGSGDGGVPPAGVHKGVPMTILKDGDLVRLRGFRGMLIRPGEPNTGMWATAQPPGWRDALYDGFADGDTRCFYKAKKLTEIRFTFTNVDQNCLLGADAGQYAPSIDKCAYHKPSGNVDAGELEQFRVYTNNENGALEAQTEQTTDQHHPSGPGKKFFSPAFTVEVVG